VGRAPLARDWRAFLAADARPAYDPHGAGRAEGEPAPRPVSQAEVRARGLTVDSIEEGTALLAATLDAIARLDLAQEPDEAIRTAAVELATVRNRLDGAHVGVLSRLEATAAYRADGAVTAASWYRARTRTNPGEATDLLRTAVRLGQLPALCAALEQGAVSLRHVGFVTRAATPARMAGFQEAEEALTALARAKEPRVLAVAVRRLVDLLDERDEPDPELPDGPADPRRALQLHRTIDGLWDLAATLDPVTGELLCSLLDSLRAPDPPDTPVELLRSAAQRNHDAFAELVRRASGLTDLPSVHGRAPHAAVFVDLFVLAKVLGWLPEGILEDAEDRPAARLRHGGPISPLLALRLLCDATLTVVQTEGPWRPVSVGRRLRTLPPYLRDVLDLLHTRCRGPDCDRYLSWADAHHVHPWDAGGHTDLNNSIPLCRKHHRLVDRGWTVTLDTSTGLVTWTSRAGTTHHNHP
jgi:hypothetical protein